MGWLKDGCIAVGVGVYAGTDGLVASGSVGVGFGAGGLVMGSEVAGKSVMISGVASDEVSGIASVVEPVIAFEFGKPD